MAKVKKEEIDTVDKKMQIEMNKISQEKSEGESEWFTDSKKRLARSL